MNQWGPDRAELGAELLRRCLPAEEITDDELRASLFEDPDPSTVIGHDDDRSFVGAVLRRHDQVVTVHLQVVAVDPDVRRQGRGRELLGAVAQWGSTAGASAVITGAGAPFYLWPGVDFTWTPALCFFESLGYVERRPGFNMRFADAFRADAPLGTEVRRVLDESDAQAVEAFATRHHANWVAELLRAIEHGTAFGGWQDDEVIGFACHSVNRLGWVGPMATHPERRSSGVGGALLSALTADLRPLDRGFVEVAWVGPVSFYAKAADAQVSRVFRVLSRRLA
ncbi:MAG: GNAT family N-acetyltransferase [Acidimicrobiales bacterium]